MKYFFLIFFILVSTVSFAISNTGAGGIDFTILSVPIGGRGSGMGGAFAPIADDISSIYWNSAGLVNMHEQEVYSHALLYQNSLSTSIFLGYHINIRRVGHIAAAWSIFITGNIDQITADYARLDKFADIQNAVYLSYAKRGRDFGKRARWLKFFNFGVVTKFLNHTITSSQKYSFSTFDMDLSINFNPRFYKVKWLRNFNFSLQFKNVVPNYKEENKDLSFLDKVRNDPNPPSIHFGIAYTLFMEKLKLTTTFYKYLAKKSSFYFSTGVEYWIKDMIGLRTGYNFETNALLKVISGGISFRMMQFNVDYSISYNFIISSLFHTMSFSFKFGKYIP